jgi:nitrous oxidase accessory protein NosD
LIGWNSADAANGSGVIVISSTSVVHGCTIISNTSTLYGGSTLYYYDDNSMISNCLVRYNSGLTFFMNNNNANTLNINWGIHLTGVAATCSMRGDGRLSP